MLLVFGKKVTSLETAILWNFEVINLHTVNRILLLRYMTTIESTINPRRNDLFTYFSLLLQYYLNVPQSQVSLTVHHLQYCNHFASIRNICNNLF